MVRSLNVMVCTVVMSALLPAVAVYAGETGSDDILLLTDTGASELSSDVEEENVIDADMLDNGTYEYTVNPDGTLTITGLAGETAETGLDDPVIPGQIAGRKVTAIGKEAFDGGASLRGKLTLSEGIKTVGEHAFSGCNELTELSLPESLVAIKAGGFDNCDLTCKLDLKNVKEIGDEAFANNV
ncbi:MAG: leucine-rich repeat domain-containing protein, partial [Lachnospiraceae bacterium]|nr:leucine-rich repeat domain-containing protein [Lachnospiraceae bacterium]